MKLLVVQRSSLVRVFGLGDRDGRKSVSLDRSLARSLDRWAWHCEARLEFLFLVSEIFEKWVSEIVFWTVLNVFISS